MLSKARPNHAPLSSRWLQIFARIPLLPATHILTKATAYVSRNAPDPSGIPRIHKSMSAQTAAWSDAASFAVLQGDAIYLLNELPEIIKRHEVRGPHL